MCVPVPTAVGVYVTEHVAELPLPESVQLPPEPKVPAPLEVKLTVPVGVVAPVPPVSVTVAVHVVAAPIVTVAGEQLTEVEVERFAASTVTVVEPELPE